MSHSLNKLVNFNRAITSNNDLISGEVEIVGAGCGQLDLMTIKAARIVSQAEALVYDSLVSSDILSLVSVDCQRHFVGKRCGQPSYKQDAINELLAKLAFQGLKVVRLKGGDPHIFGRGAEESLYLAKMGITSRFTPGITAALGCASTTGIPLTYRGTARSVTLVTGTKFDQSPTHWKGLLEAESTLVFYMGKEQATAISAGLMAVNADTNLPVAFVTNGGRPNQMITYANVTNMAEQAKLIKDSGPTLIIIGEVVAVGQELAALLTDIKANPQQMAEVVNG